MRIPRLVIAGASSGVGKTTIVAGLIAALRRRGLKVQPFKVGPDYLDPTYHTLASSLPCRNLDGWMLPDGALRTLFFRAAARAHLALIEGVMGLYDGRGGAGEDGSTAEIAKRLRAPVLLVLDAAKVSRSAGAMALGYKAFDLGLPLAGFLLNGIASARHLGWAREAVEKATGLPVLGSLPKGMEVRLPKRHLGLVAAAEDPEVPAALERIGQQIETNFDLEAILEIGAGAPPLLKPEHVGLFPVEPVAPSRIAVARDAAFSFYYEDSLDLLEAWGATLVPVSPLRDPALPDDVHGLYLGGGFPELHAAGLEANASFRGAVRDAAAEGMPIYGECGGLMYLAQAIVTFEGRCHEMVGLTPGRSTMQRKRARIGYVEAEALQDVLFLRAGQRIRAHEFHWSDLPGPERSAAYRTLAPEARREGFVAGPAQNVLGTYLHLHLGSDPALPRRFVAACARFAGLCSVREET